MGFKLIFRTTLFLAIMFVMVYVGMTNTNNIPFHCDLVSPKPIVQPAALVYFVIFAIGVVAGTLFNVGGGKSSKGSSSSKGGKER